MLHRDILFDAALNGAFRFNESDYFARITSGNNCQIPDDWKHLIPDYEMIMFFDEITGEVYVVYGDDILTESELTHKYDEIIDNFHRNAFNFPRCEMDYSSFIYPVKKPTVNGFINIPKLLLRGKTTSDRERIDALPNSDVILRGFSHGFTIRHADNLWAVDQSKPPKEWAVSWPRVFSLNPIIKDIKRKSGFNALERNILSTNHPSSPERSLIDPEYGGVLSAPPLGSAEPS